MQRTWEDSMFLGITLSRVCQGPARTVIIDTCHPPRTERNHFPVEMRETTRRSRARRRVSKYVVQARGTRSAVHASFIAHDDTWSSKRLSSDLVHGRLSFSNRSAMVVSRNLTNKLQHAFLVSCLDNMMRSVILRWEQERRE